MILRARKLTLLEQLIDEFPVVALIGARQIGKTTLAKQLKKRWPTEVHYFDLESTIDVTRLSDPMLALKPLRGLIILDEVQHLPEIFSTLRVLVDRVPGEARFLVLGSAAPTLLRQTSESLEGRIAYFELSGLDISEVGIENIKKLWIRGGFPKSFTAESDASSYRWRANFVRTFLERDVPQFGITISSRTLHRFWTMLAHYHAQTWNGAELGRAFGVSHTTVRNYLDVLESTFMVHSLKPWNANISKRQVRSPKVYIRDSGLFHSLLGIKTYRDLEYHPKIGASWEGFILENLNQILELEDLHSFYWATHNGAEIDLVTSNGGQFSGYEIKRTSSPKITRSMYSAINDLGLHQIDVIYAGEHSFQLSPKIRVIAAIKLLDEYLPQLSNLKAKKNSPFD